jgi:DNA-directed RNA polymerase specialized sigma24 family protein
MRQWNSSLPMAYLPTVTDRELVLALRAGDRLAAGQVYDIYGTRLYAYSHELLGDHKQAGDALRDAFIVAVNRIRELRRPDELGSWLYALVRGECRRVGISDEVPQDAADAARGDRLARIALDCYAMLPPETRELLDLAFRHRLVDADLGRVLGITEEEVAARVAAAQADMENSLLVVLAARTGDPKCAEAAELGKRFEDLDGKGVDGWLQSLGRHMEKCATCSSTVRTRRPLRLFEELPHSFMPPGVRSRVLESLRDPAGTAFAERVAERAGKFDEDGFPVAGKGDGGGGRKWVLPVAFAAAIAVAAGFFYMISSGSPKTAAAATSTITTAGSSASASGSAGASSLTLPSDSTSPSASASVSPSLATSTTPAAMKSTTPAAVKTTPKVCTTTTSTTDVPVTVTITETVEVTVTPSVPAGSTPTPTVSPSPTITTSISPSPSPVVSTSCS